MKKKQIRFLLLGLIIIPFILLLITNKTFFKNYYSIRNNNEEVIKIPLPMFSYYVNEVDSASFKTIRRVNKIIPIINNYIEGLQSCYDESYFYDSNLDITISQYNVIDEFPINKIYLTYTLGNYCENQYVLDNDWANQFINDFEIEEASINEKTINKEDVLELFEYIEQEDTFRVENKTIININEDVSNYLVSVYYLLDSKPYILEIFKYNDNQIAFKVTDANDHSKNAIYNISNDVNQIFDDIYNKYK